MDLVLPDLPPQSPLRAAIGDANRLTEDAAVAVILAAADMPADARDRIAATARRLVAEVRRERLGKGGLDRARAAERHGYRHSYDMLGEAARTAADAARYRAAYERAIAAIGGAVRGAPIEAAPGISVKLSALHPRYEMAQRGRIMRELAP